MYDPKIGRWLSSDPIWPVDNINPYVYADNSPPNATDPSGLQDKKHIIVPAEQNPGFGPINYTRLDEEILKLKVTSKDGFGPLNDGKLLGDEIKYFLKQLPEKERWWNNGGTWTEVAIDLKFMRHKSGKEFPGFKWKLEDIGPGKDIKYMESIKEPVIDDPVRLGYFLTSTNGTKIVVWKPKFKLQKEQFAFQCYSVAFGTKHPTDKGELGTNGWLWMKEFSARYLLKQEFDEIKPEQAKKGDIVAYWIHFKYAKKSDVIGLLHVSPIE